jgi:hypothetical protein
MLLFGLLVRNILPPTVKYSSVIQIKNVYSKNRLTVTTESNGVAYEQPWVYSSRPPFDDGWMWTINSAYDSVLKAREPVKCGDNITLGNPVSELFVTTRVTYHGIEIVPSSHLRGEADFWTVVCREGPTWMRDAEVQLRNAKHGCYLSTSLDARIKDGVNRFNVTCAPLSADAVWKAVEGVYFTDSDNSQGKSSEGLGDDL